jgi:rhodanese-related sulfurtransferase
MTRLTSVHTAYAQLGLADGPILIDARSSGDIERLPRMIPGAIHLDASDAVSFSRRLPARRPVIVYGSNDDGSHAVVNTFASKGLDAGALMGGIDAWTRENLPTIRVRDELGVPGRSQWVTRERPKIDRLACPWLVRRFIDPGAIFHYAPAQSVRAQALALGAQPYDIADVTFSHRGPRCSFDAFLDEFDLRDPVLDRLAIIVRAADTATLEQSREAPGLLAISLGMSAAISDDLLLLDQAMHVYDALYTWCKAARDESHSWPQKVAS